MKRKTMNETLFFVVLSYLFTTSTATLHLSNLLETATDPASSLLQSIIPHMMQSAPLGYPQNKILEQFILERVSADLEICDSQPLIIISTSQREF